MLFRSEEGSLGDVIRVTNSRSNKIIEAKVTGNNRVAVYSNGRTAMLGN